MQNATIQRGTPRPKRDVANNKDWLSTRVETLESKIEVLQDRIKNAKKEKKVREKQLSAL